MRLPEEVETKPAASTNWYVVPQFIYPDHLLLFFSVQGTVTEQSLSPCTDNMPLWNTTPDDSWHTFDVRTKSI
jgi:hypothetical protein